MAKKSTTIVGKLGGAWRFPSQEEDIPVPWEDPEFSPNPIVRRTPLLDEENQEYEEIPIAKDKDGVTRIVLLRPKRKRGGEKRKRGNRR